MFEVEHLVVEEVLDGAARGVGTIEDAGDDDGVVGGVVVAEHAAGVVGAPGEGGAAEEAVKEAGVEGFEDLVEVVEADVQAALAEPDGGVEGGEAAKADVERWDGSPGTEIAVLLFKYGDEC